MNKFLLSMSILLLFLGCTLKSRDSFDLKYQDQNVMFTLDNGPLKEIKSDGSFDLTEHMVFDFSMEEMQVEIYSVKNSEKQPDSVFYSIEIVEDISYEQGILRFYGAGPLDSKFIGVVAETNGEGAFLKFAFQDTEDNIIENANSKEKWEFVTNPIIFRINTLFPNQEIVSLSSEEFFEISQYSYYIPTVNKTGNGTKYALEYAKVNGETTSDKKTISIISTKLMPLFIEIYKIRDGGAEKYLAIQFNEDASCPKMKIAQGRTESQALQSLQSLSYFNFQLRSTAIRPNRVFRTIGKNIMVKLTKEPSAKPLTGLYYWEGTEELNLDPDKMTMSVISTYSTIPPYDPIGITNFSDYVLKVAQDRGDNEGIFSIKGRGKYNELFGGFKAERTSDNRIFLDFVTGSTELEVSTKLALITTLQGEFQDKTTAIRPYRLIENMESIGREWVQLTNDGTDGMKFDPKNTQVFSFLSILDRTLQFSSIKDGILEESFYKVVVVDDINDTNGVIKLVGYTDDTFTTPNPDTPMNNKYIAIDRGSELYKTQAKYAVGISIEDARAKLSQVSLFNFHEKRSVPSNHRVIAHMESYGVWVGLLYSGCSNPGVVPNSVVSGAKPTYAATDTIKWSFNTTLSLKLTVTVVSDGVSQSPGIYEITPIDDVSERYGIFKLTRTSGNNRPNLNNMYLAIRTGEGTEGDRGYVGFGADQESAVRELNRIFSESDKFMNYHAEATAPVTANVIKTISERTYMEYEVDVSGMPDGNLKPYNTSEYVFDFNTLTMTINTYTPTSPTESKSVYNINMRLDEGDYAGVFQALANGSPLHNKFFRIDVQQGANQKQKIRILQGNSFAELIGSAVAPIVNKNAFTVSETTHGDIQFSKLPEGALDNLVGVSSVWASVSADDQMYDFKNARIVTFNTTVNPRKIKITDIELGAVKEESEYTYRVMENQTTEKQMVVRLIGSGSLRNKFLAFQDVGENKNKIVFADNFQASKVGLGTALPYVIPNYPWTDENVLDSYNRLGSFNATTSPKGYGTPSFVLIKNGIYNKADTETWTFDTVQTNVRIVHTDGTIAGYTVHMISAGNKTQTSTAITRPSTLLYLKSNGEKTDPYHNHYVHIQTFINIGLTAPGTESTFTMKISPDRAVVENTETPVKYFRDLKSADIPARAITLASGYTWMRVAPNTLFSSDPYQKNKTDWEEWTFDTTATTMTVKRQDGSVETYFYAPRTDESSHRGTFILKATGGTSSTARYDNFLVAIGIGGEVLPEGEAGPYPVGTEFDRTALRYGYYSIGNGSTADLNTAENQAKQNRNNFTDWNMRIKEQVDLSFAPLKKAAGIDDLGVGWVRLKNNGSGEYIYDSADTEKWKFKPDPQGQETEDGNLIYQVEVQTSTITKLYGMKLISTSPTGVDAQFQLFVGNDSTVPAAEKRSNHFVILSLGTKSDEKRMRLGIGKTLAAAQADYNNHSFNWATLDRATAGWGGVQVAQDQGNWMLTRISPSDTKPLGSSQTVSGGGHLSVSLDGTGKPVYDPANNIQFSFDTANGILSIIDISGSKIQQSSYSMIKIDNGSSSRESLETVFSLNGIGPYNNQFVYLEIAEEPESANINKGKRGRLSVGTSLTEVKRKNQSLKTANTWNFFQIEWTKVDSAVFTEAARRHSAGAPTGKKLSYVELDFQEESKQDVYDTRLTRTYTIIPTAQSLEGVEYGAKSLIISNRSPLNTRDDRYFYEMVESDNSAGRDKKAIALLEGTGPDAGKYIGIRMPESGSSDIASIVLTSSLDNAKTALQWTTAVVDTSSAAGKNLYRFRTELSVTATTGILTAMSGLGNLVTLDSDRIYMNNDTTEWTFTPEFNEATVVTRSSSSSGSTIVNYSTILIKVNSESATKGVLYLKRPGAPLDKHFVGVEVVGSKVRYYAYNSTDTTARQKAEAVLTSTTADTTYPVNFVQKTLVYFPNTDAIFQTLANIGSGETKGGWSSLKNNFLQDTVANTTNVFFNYTTRVLTIKRGSDTYNMRFKPVIDENATPNTKAIFKIVQKGSEPVFSDFNNKFIAINLTVLEQPDSLRWASVAGTAEQDIPANIEALKTARDTTLKDPNFIPKYTFDISRATFLRFSEISFHCWQMVDAQGQLLSDDVVNAAAWNNLYNDPNTKDQAPWYFDPNSVGDNNYNMATGRIIRQTYSDNVGVNQVDRITYFARTLENSGSTEAVMRLYGATASNAELKPIYDSTISNKFFVLRVGEGTDYFMAKIASGTTLEDAKNNLANLRYFNLRAREQWASDQKGLTNMNYNRNISSGSVQQQGANWAQWVLSAGTYDPNNYSSWSFNHELSGVKSATYNVISSGVTTSYTYGLKFIVGPIAIPGTSEFRYNNTVGVYVLEGFGPHNNKFLIFGRSNTENKAILYIPTTSAENNFTSVTNAFQRQWGMGYNWQEKRQLTSS